MEAVTEETEEETDLAGDTADSSDPAMSCAAANDAAAAAAAAFCCGITMCCFQICLSFLRWSSSEKSKASLEKGRLFSSKNRCSSILDLKDFPAGL